MNEDSPKSVGLGGDGDEIVAISDVERAFGVKFDDADAPGWVTAGDLFASLQKALPEEDLSGRDVWQKFAIALSGETGANPDDIEPASPLLSESRFWARLADASAVVWIVSALGLAITSAIAALS